MGKIQEKGNNNDGDEGFFKTVVKDPVAYEELCMKAEAVFFYHSSETAARCRRLDPKSGPRRGDECMDR